MSKKKMAQPEDDILILPTPVKQVELIDLTIDSQDSPNTIVNEIPSSQNSTSLMNKVKKLQQRIIASKKMGGAKNKARNQRKNMRKKLKKSLNESTNDIEVLATISNIPFSNANKRNILCQNNHHFAQTSTFIPTANPHMLPFNYQFKSRRPIVIDGNNVARSHGRNVYSCAGIHLCFEYFKSLGHDQIHVFVPMYMKFSTNLCYDYHSKEKSIPVKDHYILQDLFNAGNLTYTPSMCYDDRFIIELAARNGGVVISNDNFKDILNEKKIPNFDEVIQKRVLKFCFAGDVFMIPQDPFGRNGPPLEQLLTIATSC